jgi:EAL domain-containing protein (putative c-di-GMP-specific phosphodiesterase class I)
MDLDLTMYGDDPDHTASPAGTRTTDTRTTDPSGFRMVADLVASGGPSIVYQPIVHVETSRLIGVEALSRFPSGLGPQRWFELAASVGLAAELEISAARNALARADAASRSILGWEIVGINISPRTLQDPRFDALLADHLGHHVVIELADPGERIDWVVVRRYIDRTRELGCRIALNALKCDPGGQFQGGQFERLLEIAPEIIKLDIGYTSALVGNRDRRRGAAEEFLHKCIQRGIVVVAVGVEDESDLVMLAELGVDAAQGYALGKPQPIERFHPADAALGLADIVAGAVWT